MRAIAVALLAAGLSSAAVADAGYFQGVTPRPTDLYSFPSSLTVTRSALPGGNGALVPALYTHVTTERETQSLEWANLTILNNHSAHGYNVAVYGQANKYGLGPTWGGVLEAQDACGCGLLWGLVVV